MGRAWGTFRTAAVIAITLAIGAAGMSHAADPAAADPDQALKKVERDLSASREKQLKLDRQSATLKADLLALRGRLVAASDAAAAQQAQLADIESALLHFEAQEKSQVAALGSRRKEIAELIGALYRLSTTPPEALIVRPEAPVDALRTALLLRAAVPALRQRAEALTASLNRLQELRRRLRSQRDEVAAARTALTDRLKEVADLVVERETLAKETESERQQNTQKMAALSSQATDLRQLLDRIEADRRAAAAHKPPEPPPPALPPAPVPSSMPEPPPVVISPAQPSPVVAEAPRASPAEPPPSMATEEAPRTLDARQRRDMDRLVALPAAPPTLVQPPQPPRITPSPPSGAGGARTMRLPAVGRVALAYGDVDRFGTTSRGLHIAAEPGTPVVAPMDGMIKFAGRFRNYGQILIVEHRNGYHSLIAGLGRIDTTVGRSVSAGEPIGIVADPADGVPDLYFELRRNGQPINPRRGIPGLDGKGQG